MDDGPHDYLKFAKQKKTKKEKNQHAEIIFEIDSIVRYNSKPVEKITKCLLE